MRPVLIREFYRIDTAAIQQILPTLKFWLDWLWLLL